MNFSKTDFYCCQLSYLYTWSKNENVCRDRKRETTYNKSFILEPDEMATKSNKSWNDR